MFGLGETYYGKKDYKDNLHSGGCYLPLLGRGKKDAPPS
jgi:hypothetical protein